MQEIFYFYRTFLSALMVMTAFILMNPIMNERN